MREQPPHMWKYWRDKHGLDHAVEHYYPETFRTDERLRQAYAQIQNARAAINTRMKELAAADVEPYSDD